MILTMAEMVLQELYLVHAAEHLPLYAQVAVPLLSEADLLRRVLLPVYSDLEGGVQQLLLHYIQSQWRMLQADAELTAALADTSFVPVAQAGAAFVFAHVCMAVVNA